MIATNDWSCSGGSQSRLLSTSFWRGLHLPVYLGLWPVLGLTAQHVIFVRIWRFGASKPENFSGPQAHVTGVPPGLPWTRSFLTFHHSSCFWCTYWERDWNSRASQTRKTRRAPPAPPARAGRYGTCQATERSTGSPSDCEKSESRTRGGAAAARGRGGPPRAPARRRPRARARNCGQLAEAAFQRRVPRMCKVGWAVGQGNRRHGHSAAPARAPWSRARARRAAEDSTGRAALGRRAFTRFASAWTLLAARRASRVQSGATTQESSPR